MTIGGTSARARQGRADRGAQLHRPARHGDDPDRRPGGQGGRRAAYKIGDTVEIRLGTVEASRRPARLQGRDRGLRGASSRRRRRCISFRAYDAVAPPAAQPPQRDVPGHDDVGHRHRRCCRPAGVQLGHDRERRATVHKFMQQSMETDLDFLRAARGDGQLRVRRGGRARLPRPAPQRHRLRRRRSHGARTPISFKPRMTAAQQHDSVTVRSYDPETKETFVGDRPARRGDRAGRGGRARDGQAVRDVGAADRRPRRQLAGRGARRSRRARSTRSPAAPSRPRA